MAESGAAGMVLVTTTPRQTDRWWLGPVAQWAGLLGVAPWALGLQQPRLEMLWRGPDGGPWTRGHLNQMPGC